MGSTWVGRGSPGERRRCLAGTCFPGWPLGNERGRQSRGGEALMREAASSAGDWVNVLMG
jgi:hypothetical protein